MLDFVIAEAIYKRVMNDTKIKNKLLGFFWREALIFLAVVAVIMTVIVLVFSVPLINAVLAVLVLLIPCAVLPVVHFKALNGKIDKE